MTSKLDLPCREALAQLRQTRPLVHNITNLVVTNWTANVLLALGASPVMAHAPEEIAEFVAMAQSVVINIGTLDTVWVAAMHEAAKRARKTGTPWVLDPVGAGATRFRTVTAKDLIARNPSVIRGNAGEIIALAGKSGAKGMSAGTVKGVDSLSGSDEAVEAARRLARRTGAIVAVTGATDYVVSADRVEAVAGGHALSQQVTGTGCAATAVIGAFLGVVPPFEASLFGLAIMKRAASLAAKQANGPGGFAVAFLDALASPEG